MLFLLALILAATHRVGARNLITRELEGDVRVSVKIYLQQPNIDTGGDHLMRISDPDSDTYAQHWRPEEVLSYFEPSPDSRRAVEDWLDAHSIEKSSRIYSPQRGTLQISVTPVQAEKLFEQSIYEVYDVETASTGYGVEEYKIPAHLHSHIDFVTPTIDDFISSSRSMQKKRATLNARSVQPSVVPKDDLTECYELVTPQCIAALYGIPKSTHPPIEGNSLGIYNTEQLIYGNIFNASYAQSDLNSFYSRFYSTIPNGTDPIPASINEGTVSTTDAIEDGSEPILDYEVSLPIIYPQNVTAFVTGYRTGGFQPSANATDITAVGTGVEAFLDAIDFFYCRATGAPAGNDCGTYRPTNVISFSYAAFENDINYKYAIRVCNEFLKLGLQGHTILIAAGDSQLGTGETNTCGGKNNQVFTPEWFATCPWYQARRWVEEHWATTINFGGGGGFSNYYYRPSYQNNSVEHYLNTANLTFPSYSQFRTSSGNFSQLGANSDGLYNRPGRAYPDVSAIANAVAAGIATQFEGTSAATPIWGAIITRINEERLRAGKRPVGFINPVLYKNPGALNDVVIGEAVTGCSYNGFSAQEGWDPATGLGSPKYPELLKLFMALP